VARFQQDTILRSYRFDLIGEGCVVVAVVCFWSH